MRHPIRRLALLPGVIAAAGALSLAGSAAAGASTIPGGSQDYSPAPVGYQAGNGNWNFRFVTTDFAVPESACRTGQNRGSSFEGAGVQLNSGTGTAALGVTCKHHTPYAGYELNYTGTTDPGSFNNTLAVTPDDEIRAQLYYDQSNNRVYLTETDLTEIANSPDPHSTTNGILVQDSFRAKGAQYTQAFAGALVDNPLKGQLPDPGSSFVLVPFTNTHVTSYDGTRGEGIEGPWSVQADYARDGAHTTAAAPDLYDGYTTFNVREYGNS